MLIEIPGMTEDSLLNAKTESTGGGLRPFPCDANNWTKHTAEVIKCTIKTFEVAGKAKDNISMLVGNAQFGGEILIGLDINDIPANLTPEKAQKAKENNLKTLQMAIKILGCHTNGKLDTAKLEKAHGQAVEIIAKHKGFREHEGRHYHKVSLLLTGAVEKATEVDERVGLPPLPGSAPAAAPASFDDIPF